MLLFLLAITCIFLGLYFFDEYEEFFGVFFILIGSFLFLFFCSKNDQPNLKTCQAQYFEKTGKFLKIDKKEEYKKLIICERELKKLSTKK